MGPVPSASSWRRVEVATKSETQVVAEIGNDYAFGFKNSDEAENYFFKSGRGISHELSLIHI